MTDYTLFHKPGNDYAAGLFAGSKDQELKSGWSEDFRKVGYLSIPQGSFQAFSPNGNDKGVPIKAVGPQFNSRDLELERKIQQCLRDRFGEGVVAVDDLFRNSESIRPTNNFYAYLLEDLDLYGAYVDGVVKEILAVRVGVTDPVSDPLKIIETYSGMPNVRFNISDDHSGGWGDGAELIGTSRPEKLIHVGAAIGVPRSVLSMRQWYFGRSGTKEIGARIFLSH
jgi:hypothetical protein